MSRRELATFVGLWGAIATAVAAGIIIGGLILGALSPVAASRLLPQSPREGDAALGRTGAAVAPRPLRERHAADDATLHAPILPVSARSRQIRQPKVKSQASSSPANQSVGCRASRVVEISSRIAAALASVARSPLVSTISSNSSPTLARQMPNGANSATLIAFPLLRLPTLSVTHAGGVKHTEIVTVSASRSAEHSDLPYPSGSLTGGTPSSGVARRTGAPTGPFLATLASGAPSSPSVGSHPARDARPVGGQCPSAGETPATGYGAVSKAAPLSGWATFG